MNLEDAWRPYNPNYSTDLFSESDFKVLYSKYLNICNQLVELTRDRENGMGKISFDREVNQKFIKLHGNYILYTLFFYSLSPTRTDPENNEIVNTYGGLQNIKDIMKKGMENGGRWLTFMQRRIDFAPQLFVIFDDTEMFYTLPILSILIDKTEPGINENYVEKVLYYIDWKKVENKFNIVKALNGVLRLTRLFE